jgi:hypothetical protein
MHDVAHPQLGKCNRQADSRMAVTRSPLSFAIDLPAGVPSLTTLSSLGRPPGPSKLYLPAAARKGPFQA